MSDSANLPGATPAFNQPERRSLLVPIIVALAALAAAIFIAVHFYPATTVNINHVHVDAVPTSTVFKSDTIVVGVTHTENTLFLAETLQVDNQLRVPIYLDNFSMLLTNASGAQLETKAATREELASIRTAFPRLVPLTDEPLVRETAIDPGKQVQGTLVFSLRVPQSMWDARQSAVVKVELYHQPALYLTIPKS